mgnify:FL=1
MRVIRSWGCPALRSWQRRFTGITLADPSPHTINQQLADSVRVRGVHPAAATREQQGLTMNGKLSVHPLLIACNFRRLVFFFRVLPWTPWPSSPLVHGIPFRRPVQHAEHGQEIPGDFSGPCSAGWSESSPGHVPVVEHVSITCRGHVHRWRAVPSRQPRSTRVAS